jgi:monofunctional biosynthetic peptidoglycan transglycosylase
VITQISLEPASRHYYGKPSSELTPQEAAKLAAVLPNPRKYNPVGEQQYVMNRSNAIYNMMIQRGIVIPEYEEAAETNEILKWSPTGKSAVPRKNTHLR